MDAEERRKRVVIAAVRPEVDCYPIKCTVGERVTVETGVFADGHDLQSCVLPYHWHSESQWGETKRQRPEGIFLSEAFTRPDIVRRLAKLGFTQSYTYFAWRNTK